MIEQISVNLNDLYTNKLKLEDYFILFCLVEKEEEILSKYTSITGGVPTEVFHRLRNSGFIILKDEVNITFNSIVITEQTKTIFKVTSNEEFDTLFKEVLSTYPRSVKRLTGGTRPLHNDLPRCKKLYKQTIVHNRIVDINLHKKILLCMTKFYKDHLKDNKQEFMPLLATFLSQRNWEQYLENVIENKPIITQSDDI